MAVLPVDSDSVDKTTVGFDDDIDNGFDENVGLKILQMYESNRLKEKNLLPPVILTPASILSGGRKQSSPKMELIVSEPAADDSARVIIGNVSGKGKIGIGKWS